MKKWENHLILKNYSNKIRNAKPNVKLPKPTAKPTDLKPLTSAKASKMEPQKPRVLESAGSNKSSISDYYESEKLDLINIPLYRLLKIYNLQQYAKQLISRGFGYDLQKFMFLSKKDLESLILEIKVLPGHKTKLLGLLDYINSLFITLDYKPPGNRKTDFGGLYQEKTSNVSNIYLKSKSASSLVRKKSIKRQNSNKEEKKNQSQRGRKGRFKLENVGCDFFRDSMDLDDDFSKTLERIMSKYQEEMSSNKPKPTQELPKKTTKKPYSLSPPKLLETMIPTSKQNNKQNPFSKNPLIKNQSFRPYQALDHELATAPKSKLLLNLRKTLLPGSKKEDFDLAAEFQRIKTLYISFDSGKLTSTLINLDIEEMTYCLACVMLKFIEFGENKGEIPVFSSEKARKQAENYEIQLKNARNYKNEAENRENQLKNDKLYENQAKNYGNQGKILENQPKNAKEIEKEAKNQEKQGKTSEKQVKTLGNKPENAGFQADDSRNFDISDKISITQDSFGLLERKIAEIDQQQQEEEAKRAEEEEQMRLEGEEIYEEEEYRDLVEEDIGQNGLKMNNPEDEDEIEFEQSKREIESILKESLLVSKPEGTENKPPFKNTATFKRKSQSPVEIEEEGDVYETNPAFEDSENNNEYCQSQMEDPSKVNVSLCSKITFFDENAHCNDLSFSRDLQGVFERAFNEKSKEKWVSAKPSKDTISNFCKNIIITAKMEKEVTIICLIYIEKLVLKSGLHVTALNWRRIVFIALILASKLWDDESYENDNFSQAFPQYTTQEINSIEMVFLQFIDFELYIDSSQYAKYYFILRTFAEKNKKSFPLRALDINTIISLQNQSSNVQRVLKEAFISSLNKTF